MKDNSNAMSMVHYCRRILDHISIELRDMQNALSYIEAELAEEEVEENEA